MQDLKLRKFPVLPEKEKYHVPQKMEIDRFNIRVYGLLIDEGRILVTDEFRLGTLMTKFPGGGLNFGEGTLDCLRREFREEMNTEISGITHYYTTEYFQPTKLLPSTMQLFSIYYLVKVEKPYGFKTTDKKFDFPEIVDGAQNFRWIRISELSEDEFTFPIDKTVASMLRSGFSVTS
jgi:8-oxo-dGTP diphosphatase